MSFVCLIFCFGAFAGDAAAMFDVTAGLDGGGGATVSFFASVSPLFVSTGIAVSPLYTTMACGSSFDHGGRLENRDVDEVFEYDDAFVETVPVDLCAVSAAGGTSFDGITIVSGVCELLVYTKTTLLPSCGVEAVAAVVAAWLVSGDLVIVTTVAEPLFVVVVVEAEEGPGVWRASLFVAGVTVTIVGDRGDSFSSTIVLTAKKYRVASINRVF